MKDTFAARFESREAAETALRRMSEGGWESDRMSIRRVFEHPEHRGFGDDAVAYSLIHAPQIPVESTIGDEATVVLLLVDMPQDIDGGAGLTEEGASVYDRETTRRALEQTGAVEVTLVEGSPPKGD